MNTKKHNVKNREKMPLKKIDYAENTYMNVHNQRAYRILCVCVFV